ncbi:MAG TPA: hypothetical protein PK544_17130 [Spirochaetota bacterium]|nr:hypothetical protein [Spirochaetota bacterium]HPQ52325.1 hypothetical protein [Spirochaetota bacterium]
MKKRVKKKGFPFGIFFLLLFSLLLLGCMISAGYFYFGVKNEIAEVETITKKYSTTLAEAFTDVAEFSYRYKNYGKLTTLFREKIRDNSIDEAFFVLADGTIVVHSNRDVERELRGNIINDEFAYNIDMIMMPLRRKERAIQFNEYNILNKRVPFNRLEKKLIRKYLYKNIFVNGWLVTKAVFVQTRRSEEPVGTVNFILGKDKIYSLIFRYIKEVKYIASALGILSLLIALIVSVIVFGRYRKLYRIIEQQVAGDAGGLAAHGAGTAAGDIVPAGFGDDTAAQPVDESLLIAADAGHDEDTPYQATEPVRQYREEIHFDVQKSVKDAIPVKKRRGR